ncbi:DUF599 domain-containing protein [Neptuniibacter caesariensis]|uniref:DUF599 domain-containing protein n=1 Tax=Neptuniibacter caesariensis TaxID=207954 RepID=A0A7U8GT45_NEPCE|nr:DUF599 family protein [Neptuniibacter caesariensis]EAR61933.1 hypothetical protein MED92_03258 [Oceanospirillum sp. MED92] [Neptuniibacter caesariensis]
MEPIQQFIQENWLNLLALVWFLICFKGYMYYAKKRSYDTPCLASMLHMYRREWMKRMLTHEVRIADTTAIANLERGVSFFASTTMLILAGLMTVLGSTQQAIDVVADIPFARHATRGEWELKILLMISLFVYAFFKFTWSLRQYGFVSIMIGGAPQPEEQISETQAEAHANRIAKMTSMAANNFNIGLRTYYFCLAILGWFINPWLFMVLSGGVVFVLYRREFKSSTLKTLMMSDGAEK